MMIQTFIFLAALFGTTNPDVATYKVNTTESVVKWKGTKVIGGGHEGTLSFKSGSLEIDNGKLKGGSFVVDMTSLACTDLEGEKKGQLEGHLTSDDFFGVESNPESTLTIKSVKKGDNGSTNVTADLTIKGKTESITFPALMKTEGNTLIATAQVTFDRSKFDVRYGSGSFFDNLGDRAISDDIVLDVQLKASL